ncbi:uncharacterized protein LOC135694132 isoform X2 [Rhopilema esculentum]|uniref:uncharacterized protein LOC135694132 isoform X2 n=1 Tax=Rhopilema esculentum TaxID=499914 RepID=UPI0031CE36C4
MAMLEGGDPEFLSDTTSDVESIPEETVRRNMASSPKEAAKSSHFGKTRPNAYELKGGRLETRDDTEEIIRGFILEKDILKEEHKKEKEEIVDSLIKDRNELIDKFRKRVSELERKIGNDQGESSRPKDSGIYMTDKGMPIYIKMDKNNVISAEEFLSRLRLEDKYETEKDTLERSFRDERRLLKDKLEFDYNSKLQQESSKFRLAVDDLRRTITNLKHENRRLESELKNKEQESNVKELEMKSKFKTMKANLETSSFNEKIAIREKFEEKYAKEMDVQRERYEKIFSELKTELRSKEKEVSMVFDSVKDYEEKVQRELRESVSKEYEFQFEKLRRENERLSAQVDKLERHKDELAGRVKELDDNNCSKMSILNEFSSRLNSEYEIRLKKTVLENESLRNKLEDLQAENQSKERALRNYEKSIKCLEEELSSKHVVINDNEEAKGYLRNEIKDFSHEIDLLRREKDELQKLLEEHRNTEKAMKNRMSLKETEANKALDNCKILEREKLNLERKMSLLGEELKQSHEESEALRRELKKFDEESGFFKEMLDKERKERNLLSERFRRDAEEIRRKESECCVLREELRMRENKNEMELDNDAERIDKIMELEAKNSDLQKKLNEFEEKQVIVLRKEREDIQKQFAKEFAKRIQMLKRNYEEASEGLKKEIRFLRSKISELEVTVSAKNLNTNGRMDNSIEKKVQFLEMDGNRQCFKSSPRGHGKKRDFDLGDQNTSGQSSSVRIFDYAMNHEADATSSKNKPIAPAIAPSQPHLAVDRIGRASSKPIYQGAFSRQRSRSLDSSSGRNFEGALRSSGYARDGVEMTRRTGNPDEEKEYTLPSRSKRDCSTFREQGFLEGEYDLELKVDNMNTASGFENRRPCSDRERRCHTHSSNERMILDLPPKYTSSSKPLPLSGALQTREGSARFLGRNHRNWETGHSTDYLKEGFETQQECLFQRSEHEQFPENNSKYVLKGRHEVYPTSDLL